MKLEQPKPIVVDETGGKHNLQLFYDTYMRYIALSKFLFSGKNPIYDINEMSQDCDFYQDAVSIAEQLEINWDAMTHEDSNRIMLALLEDTYQAMLQVSHKKNLVIEVKLKIIKNESGSHSTAN